MANDPEIMLKMAARIGTARAEAVRLLEAVEDRAGVWMHNLSTGAKALVRHEDTLARLITEGWTHEAPSDAPATQPTPSEAAGAASSTVADDSPSPATEATPAPPNDAVDASSDVPAAADAPLTKGKKA